MRKYTIIISAILIVVISFFLGYSSGANKVQEDHETRAIFILDSVEHSSLRDSEIEYILFGESQE